MSSPDPPRPSFEGPDAELDPVGRVEWLREQIAIHDEAYYERDAPIIPDADYDELVRELRALEAAHPDLISPTSPTAKRFARSRMKYWRQRRRYRPWSWTTCWRKSKT